MTNFNLYHHTIFLTIAGSRSYGLADENSDYDYRGVIIAPLNHYLSCEDKFQHLVLDKNDSSKEEDYPDHFFVPNSDIQLLELTKFVKLAAESNPGILEILFTPEKFHLIGTKLGDRLLENRQLFVTKQAEPRFSGYAFDQLKRMTRHKAFLDSPPTHQPARSEFGLPEYKLFSLDQFGAAQALIKKEIDQFATDQNGLNEATKINFINSLEKMIQAVWQVLVPEQQFPIGEDQKYQSIEEVLFDAAAIKQGMTPNFIEFLKKERKYLAAKQNWISYNTWLKERNPKRAELEKKHGYDLKNATNLYRLFKMCREILTTGEVIVERINDADEIKAVKAGAFTYQEMFDYAKKQQVEMKLLLKQCKLPDEPPTDVINNKIMNMILYFHS